MRIKKMTLLCSTLLVAFAHILAGSNVFAKSDERTKKIYEQGIKNSLESLKEVKLKILVKGNVDLSEVDKILDTEIKEKKNKIKELTFRLASEIENNPANKISIKLENETILVSHDNISMIKEANKTSITAHSYLIAIKALIDVANSFRSDIISEAKNKKTSAEEQNKSVLMHAIIISSIIDILQEISDDLGNVDYKGFEQLYTRQIFEINIKIDEYKRKESNKEVYKNLVKMLEKTVSIWGSLKNKIENNIIEINKSREKIGKLASMKELSDDIVSTYKYAVVADRAAEIINGYSKISSIIDEIKLSPIHLISEDGLSIIQIKQ